MVISATEYSSCRYKNSRRGPHSPLAANDRKRHRSRTPLTYQKTGSGHNPPCCRHDKTGPQSAALTVSSHQISKRSCAWFRLRFLCVDMTISPPAPVCQDNPSVCSSEQTEGFVKLLLSSYFRTASKSVQSCIWSLFTGIVNSHPAIALSSSSGV